MVWSNWTGAVVVMLAWVGLAWSQAPMPTSSVGTGERIMTVHENGKGLRCQLMLTWHLQDGSTAYQVKNIDTGEMLTIVEDGPVTTTLEGKAKVMPMRIFHWGSSRVAPPGVPTPPGTVVTSSASSGKTPFEQPTSRVPTVVDQTGPYPVITMPGDGSRMATSEVIVDDPSVVVLSERNPTFLQRLFGGNRVGTNQPEFSSRLTFGEKIQNLIHPRRNAAETTIMASADSTGAPTMGEAPFSTAADGSGTDKSAAADKRPLVQAAPKRDWRSMWGQQKDTKAQVPGQSMVEQAAGKPDPKGTPPTSMVDKNSADVLLNPEKFDPNGERLAPKGINMNAYRGDPTKSLLMAQAPAMTQTGEQNPSNLPPPLGSRSVLAAGGNVPTRITYVPVPVATMPDPYRPPMPPAPKLPEPPQLNAYVNAFTPPPPPQNKLPQNPMMVNAFSNGNPQGPGYGPNYLPDPMTQGSPMAPGYPPNPNMMMAQGAPNPNYYGPQGSLPPVPGRPLAQTNNLQQYQGPQPPNPYPPQTQQPVQPLKYNPVPAQQPTLNQAMDRRQLPAAASPNPELAQIIQVMRESPYPAQREWASNTLAAFDWRAYPEVVPTLLQSAQQDPAATVRASCVYCLGRMNAAGEPVVSTLYSLRSDRDPRVRQEVEQALVRLGAIRQ